MRYVEIKSPQSSDYLQSIRHCQLIFDLSSYEVREITQKLLDASMIAPNSLHYLVAKEEEDLTGFVVYYYLQKIRLGYLDYIATIDQFRGRGIGSQLYGKMIEELQVKHPDIEGIVYEVKSTDADFEERVRFFEKQGAQILKLEDFPLPQSVIDSGLIMMYQPLKPGAKIQGKDILDIFRVLSETLWH